MSARKLRILDFDMECLPGHWIGGDYVSKIITAVAWGWRDDPLETIHYRTHYQIGPGEMAIEMAAAIAEADIVTGHYIRGFDLPLLNGMLLYAGQRPMSKVVTVDTKLDLSKAHGRSLSQKNLAALIGVDAPKVDVTLSKWEGFNLRTPGFEEAGIERVVGDVLQHKEMYGKLIDMGWITTPKVWSPESKGSAYRA